MAQSIDLLNQIQSAGSGPAEAEADGQRVKQQPLPDLVTADRYLKANAAARRPMRGLYLTRLYGPLQCPAPTANAIDQSVNNDGF